MSLQHSSLLEQVSGQAHQPGLLVTLDGPSGAGKTTVAAHLVRLLNDSGLVASATAQPSTSTIGRLARTSTHQLRGLALTCLVAADRYDHIATVIEPAVAAGEIVVCDRYVPSAYVLDGLDGAEPGFIRTLYAHARSADLAVFLTAEPQVCLDRAQQRGIDSRFHHSDLASMQRECALFDDVAEQYRGSGAAVLRCSTGEVEAAGIARVIADRIVAARTTPSVPGVQTEVGA